MDRVGIKQVIDHFEAAWVAADLPPFEGPAEDIETVLADIAVAIAPMELPTDVLAFWRRVAPETLYHVAPYPEPTSPSFALRCWLQHEEGRST